MTAPQVWLDIDLTPQPTYGFSYIYPTVQVTDPTEGITLTTAAVGQQFNGSEQSLLLYATDNANMAPAGWAWFLDFSQNPSVSGRPTPTTFFAPVGPCTFTATHATPCVFTWTPTAAFTAAFSGYLPNGTAMTLAGGSLPSGFSAATTYYVVSSGENTFELSLTRGGSPIASTGTGSGSFTVTRYSYSGLVPAASEAVYTPFATELQVAEAQATAEAYANTLVSGAVNSLNPQFLTAGTVYSAAADDNALADCTTGNTTVNLPHAPADKTVIAVKLLKQNTPSGSVGFYTVAVNAQGGDKFETSTGGTTASLTLVNEAATWQYNAAQAVWIRQWGVLPWSQIQKNMPAVYNVLDYGADKTGTNDSTAAIQAAINQATGSAAPSTNTRTPVAAVYLPSGTYKITSDLIIRSVSGFKFIGDGPGNTLILLSGTSFTQAALFIDGSLDGVFEGFSMQGNGTEQVTNGIRLDWTTAAFRSTTGNRFSDIRIRALNAVALFSLECNSTRQCDGTYVENVIVTGSQTPGSWSNSGNWQKGFAVGNGTVANNYDHTFIRCDAAQLYYGWYVSASGVSVTGTQLLGNFCDFYIAAAAQNTISNAQSQDSGQFLILTGVITPPPVSLSEIYFFTVYPSAPNTIITQNGAVLHIDGLYAWVYTSSTFQAPVISINNYSGKPATATLDNITLFGTKTTTIVPQSSFSNVVVRNYVSYNPGTGAYAAKAAGDLLSAYTGSAWVNLDQGGAVAPGVQFVTATGSYTWSKPAGAQTVDVVLCAGGAGGGSGAIEISGTAAGGGGGGGGGGYTARTFVASDLPSSVTGTVGAGGTGASATTGTVAANGSPGNYGNNTTFGAYLTALFGILGSGGTVAGGAAGSGTAGLAISGAGGAGGAGAAGAGGASSGGASGGGGGGGVATGGTAFNGGASSYTLLGASSNTGAGGVVSGASPGTGTAPTTQGTPSCGGGGGAAAFGVGATAQGGATPFYGGGGGGGGAAAGVSGTLTSGAGGNGGDGFALIISHLA
jgi:hypothetical protein